MRFSFWLRKWQRAATAAHRRTQTTPRQRASFRPRLEALEDRALPSVGGPTLGPGGGSNGGGPGSSLPSLTASNVSQLISDINYANLHGGKITISLEPNTTFDLITQNNAADGGNGLPVIGGQKALSLTILGNGDTIERASSNSFRLLDVAKGASLTLDRVTLQNGDNSWGGAVYNQGALNVRDNSILSGNFAFDGSGIYNFGGTVTVSRSTLSGNTATAPPPGCGAGDGYGSGIYNEEGTVTVADSTLSGNVDYVAGAIANFYGGTMTVTNSTLSDNPGGGIAVCGGNVSVNSCILASNAGSGIYIVGGTVSVNTCTLTGNSGSGIQIDAGTLTISNSTLSDNSAYNGGGIDVENATVSISNSILSGNSAYYGGGIYNFGGTVSVSTCTLTGNSAKTGSYYTSSGSSVTFGGLGGGIYNAVGALTVNNSDFENNSPDNIYGTYSGSGNTGLS